jgi:hypothetical protein
MKNSQISAHLFWIFIKLTFSPLCILLYHKPFAWTLLCVCLFLFEKPQPNNFRTKLNPSSSLWWCGWLIMLKTHE